MLEGLRREKNFRTTPAPRLCRCGLCLRRHDRGLIIFFCLIIVVVVVVVVVVVIVIVIFVVVIPILIVLLPLTALPAHPRADSER